MVRRLVQILLCFSSIYFALKNGEKQASFRRFRNGARKLFSVLGKLVDSEEIIWIVRFVRQCPKFFKRSV